MPVHTSSSLTGTLLLPGDPFQPTLSAGHPHSEVNSLMPRNLLMKEMVPPAASPVCTSRGTWRRSLPASGALWPNGQGDTQGTFADGAMGGRAQPTAPSLDAGGGLLSSHCRALAGWPSCGTSGPSSSIFSSCPTHSCPFLRHSRDPTLPLSSSGPEICCDSVSLLTNILPGGLWFPRAAAGLTGQAGPCPAQSWSSGEAHRSKGGREGEDRQPGTEPCILAAVWNL